MNKNEILVNHGTNYKEMTRELLEASGLNRADTGPFLQGGH